MNRGVLLLSVLLTLTSTGRGEEAPPADQKTFEIRPVKPPAPALRLSLLPKREEQIAGDAAVFYHRAIESLIGVRYREELLALKKPDPSGGSAEQSVSDWLALPSDQFPREDVRTLVERRATALEEARLGTLRETCDWGFRRRSEGFLLLLGDLQEARGLARWIALKARLDLEEGRIEESLQGVKTGLALARDLGRSESYIQTLIAVAAANQMLDVMDGLVQRPTCPSLYWALASLPRPLMDLAAPTESESAMLDREFPMLARLESDVWSIETARAFSDQVAGKLGMLIDGRPRLSSPPSRPSLQDLPEHASQVVRIARAYPGARRLLRETGFPEERLDAMPMIQVVGIASYRDFQFRRDEDLKWMFLPLWLGAKEKADASGQSPPRSSGIPFADLISASRSTHAAVARLERRLALLQLVEAIRLYASSHDGALPASLDELSEAPALPDPMSGRPFDYRIAGDEAVVTSLPPADLEYASFLTLRYRFRKAPRQAAP
ncbi:hypothetical protein [Planctomyces sp. SH-PL62]|uniref:hypothetical protein n=1 Tax=Planctomyces sp. SH-PL62 TaxID=1636152 RepID=UPI00078C7CBB|nr:hypothetical protein [Planctomyces sp. SH-PL62]AMV39277.1 hypothetical protein VT85_17700 [Planctomyces sp. SH-PL62]